MPTSNLPIASQIAWPDPDHRADRTEKETDHRRLECARRDKGSKRPTTKLEHSPSKPFFLVKRWSKNSLLYLRDKPESKLDLLDLDLLDLDLLDLDLLDLGIWTSTLKLPRIPSDPNVMSQSCQEKLESGRKPSGGWMTKPDVCVREAIIRPFPSQQLLEPVDKDQG